MTSKTSFINTYAPLSTEVNTVCQPIKKFGVNFFSYSRIDKKNNDLLYLCTDQQYLASKIEQDLFDGYSFVKDCMDLGYKKYLLFGDPPQASKLQQYLFSKGIWNSADFYFDNSSYIEIFHFGGSREDPGLLNFYANNDPLFSRFALYFKESFSKIIHDSHNLLSISPNTHNTFNESDALLSFNSKMIEEFWAETNYSKVSVTIRGKDISLSKREWECIKYILHGLRAKDIAFKLNISYRTVEEYINHAKQKIGYLHMSDLSNLFKYTIPYNDYR